MCKDKRGAVDLFDNICHSKGFSRTGNSEQNLFLIAVKHTVCKAVYSLRLIAHRLII